MHINTPMPRRRPHPKSAKRTIKYLASSQHPPSLIRKLLRGADPKVIKIICNAALNAREGDIRLSPKLRAECAKQKRVFAYLCNRKVPVAAKHRYLVQKGGAAFLPSLAPLLGTVLSTLGSALFGRLTNQSE